MRSIGTMPDEETARRFADYLLTLGITTKLASSVDGVVVWVHKEDLITKARKELEQFLASPDDPRYEGAARQAEQLRKQAAVVEREHARRTIDLRGKLGNRAFSAGPVTRTLIIVSVALAVVQWVNPEFGARLRSLLLFTRWYLLDGQITNEGLEPVRQGQVWRLITPIFLHSLQNPLHLLFNMLMTLRLGRIIEARRGSLEMAFLVLVCAVVSNYGQFAFPDAFTLPSFRLGDGPFAGMSGVVYGLFGYAWIMGRIDPRSGMYLPPDSVAIMLGWLVLCATNLIGPIANTAHVVGLVVGAGFAFIEVERTRWVR